MATTLNAQFFFSFGDHRKYYMAVVDIEKKEIELIEIIIVCGSIIHV